MATKRETASLRRAVKDQGNLIKELHAAFQIQMEINMMQAKGIAAAHQRLDELIVADEISLRKLRLDVSIERMKANLASGLTSVVADQPMSGLAAQIADQDEELHDLEAGECLGNECPLCDDDHIDLSHESCEDEEIL